MRSSTASKYVSFGIWLGIGFAIVNIMVNCGGGGVTDTSFKLVTVTSFDYRDYAPLKQSVCREFNAGRWCSAVTPNGFDVTWGDDQIEENHIRQYAGEPWVMLDAYRNDKNGTRYDIKTTRVEIDYGDGWKTLPNDTNPYSPVTIVRPFTLRQWGVVAGQIKYFWQHRITPMSGVYNSCWLGLGDSNRPTLLQQEVWWDETAGWFRGTGVLKDGLPTGEVTMDFFQHIGKDAGYLWQGSGGLCLIR